MKAEMYRSKRQFPGKIIMAGRLNNGNWYIEGVEGQFFNSIEEIEIFLDDELEMVVVKH